MPLDPCIELINLSTSFAYCSDSAIPIFFVDRGIDITELFN